MHVLRLLFQPTYDFQISATFVWQDKSSERYLYQNESLLFVTVNFDASPDETYRNSCSFFSGDVRNTLCSKIQLHEMPVQYAEFHKQTWSQNALESLLQTS